MSCQNLDCRSGRQASIRVEAALIDPKTLEKKAQHLDICAACALSVVKPKAARSIETRTVQRP